MVNIEIVNDITTTELQEILAWLNEQGYNPVIKGKGNGEVYIKVDQPVTKEEVDEASSDSQENEEERIN